jgi:hypothetical protein
MTTRCAAILSAILFSLTANAAAEPAQPAEAARVYQIRFEGMCDGFEITVTGNHAAALPTGCAARQGVAVGTIARPPTGSGKVLALGQNLNGARNFVAMFLISYPLTNGGTVTLIATDNGKTVESAGSATYFLGRARSTRSAKSFLSQLERTE